MSAPIVTIGVPVRNGDRTLALALDSLTGQTFQDIEIVISDNASADRTEEICRRYVESDRRIRYRRFEQPVQALENFRATFEGCRTPYFMFAAYDDLRTANYIGTLIGGFARHPEAALVFSDVAEFDSYETYRAAEPMAHDFQTLGVGFRARVRQHTRIGCAHIYGLINAAYLRDYPWYDVQEGADVVMLFWLATRGPFVYEPGATFYYYRPPGRTAEVRARETTYRPLAPFAKERLAWACARAVADASRDSGAPLRAWRAFPPLYYHVSQGLTGMLYSWAPPRLKAAWQRLRPLVRRPASA